MEHQPSPKRAEEIAEQDRSRKLLEEAANELEHAPAVSEMPGRESAERLPDDVPIWEPEDDGTLKKVS